MNMVIGGSHGRWCLNDIKILLDILRPVWTYDVKSDWYESKFCLDRQFEFLKLYFFSLTIEWLRLNPKAYLMIDIWMVKIKWYLNG